jgi:uncharacterized protein (TIGR02646 family)
MRKIEKDFNAVPTELRTCYKKHWSNLLSEKSDHKFKSDCYNKTINNRLRKLYHDKCGYCESYIRHVSYVTVEHFRPKKGGYYWLGYEWSNLFLCCPNCNLAKLKKFPVVGKQITDSSISGLSEPKSEFCKADESVFLDEKAIFLHPEIDNPANFFEFNRAGEIIPKKKILDSDKRRATETAKEIKLNRDELAIEKRKKLIDEYLTDFENEIKYYIAYKGSTIDKPCMRMSFWNTFSKLATKAVDEKEEYTLLRKELFTRFHYFFIEPIKVKFGKDLGKLLAFAFQQYNKEEIA